MTFGTAYSARFGEAWSALEGLVRAEGSGSEAFVRTVCSPATPTRDLADAVHGLCMLQGRHPGVVESAATRISDPAARGWFDAAGAAFAAERATLVRIVAAAGPLPSTPGQAESEAAIAGQRHALDMLMASDRLGCPIGAAIALTLDWVAVRRVLDVAAHRFGLELDAAAPVPADGAILVATLAGSPAFDRAMLFGAQQLLAQHRALWQLLESRAEARDAA